MSKEIEWMVTSNRYNRLVKTSLFWLARTIMPVSLVLKAYDDLYDSILESLSIKFDLFKPLFDYFEN
jgi:hypothetical protein